jgi:hypothetical protein
MKSVECLLEKAVPIEEDDKFLIACTDALKTLHAAISNQPSLAVGLEIQEVCRLRDEIGIQASETVGTLTRLIDFGFNCHHPSSNAGMSVPLLSVALACLMALFRSEDLSKLVREDELKNLIEDAGKALLDPRLAASSGSRVAKLDEAISIQMVRAINKLAVQAATGATRHISIKALMALQLKLSLDSSRNDGALFNTRLARVITKLFARVIKAEEGSEAPFSSSTMDVDAILCCLDATLEACDEAEHRTGSRDTLDPTINQAQVLIGSILRAKGGLLEVRSDMSRLKLSLNSSLGHMVTSCAQSIDFSDLPVTEPSHVAPSEVESLRIAPIDPERDDPMRNKIEYNSDVAATGQVKDFRANISDQFSGKASVLSGDSATRNSMSERIRKLRSKLYATEAVVQSAVVSGDSGDSQDGHTEFPAHVTSSAPNSSPKNGSTYAKASSLDTAAQASASVRAFRERLAAAQEKRSTGPGTDGVAEGTLSAGSRAAALRARLQAVKKHSEGGLG